MNCSSSDKELLLKVNKFFCDILKKKSEPVYYNDIRGFASNAPNDVKDYVLKKCKGDKLLRYFENRKSNFDVNWHKEVSLKEKKHVPAVPNHSSSPEISKGIDNGTELLSQGCIGSDYHEDVIYAAESVTSKCKTGKVLVRSSYINAMLSQCTVDENPYTYAAVFQNLPSSSSGRLKLFQVKRKEFSHNVQELQKAYCSYAEKRRENVLLTNEFPKLSNSSKYPASEHNTSIQNICDFNPNDVKKKNIEKVEGSFSASNTSHSSTKPKNSVDFLRIPAQERNTRKFNSATSSSCKSHSASETEDALNDQSFANINMREIAVACHTAEILHKQGPTPLESLKDDIKSLQEFVWCSKFKIGKFKKLLQNYPYLFVIKRSNEVYLCNGYEEKLKGLRERIRSSNTEEHIFDEDSGCLLHCSGPSCEQDLEIRKVTVIPSEIDKCINEVPLCSDHENKEKSLREQVQLPVVKEHKVGEQGVKDFFVYPTLSCGQETKIQTHTVECAEIDNKCCTEMFLCSNCESKPKYSGEQSGPPVAEQPRSDEQCIKDFSESSALSCEQGSEIHRTVDSSKIKIPHCATQQNVCHTERVTGVLLPMCNKNDEYCNGGNVQQAKFILIWMAELLCMEIYEIKETLIHDADCKAVNYFVYEIKNHFQKYVPYTFLKGKLGQAPSGVSNHMRCHYPGKAFATFFQEHKEFNALQKSVCLSVSSHVDSSENHIDNKSKSDLIGGSWELYCTKDFFKLFFAIHNTIEILVSFIHNKLNVSLDRLPGFLGSVSSTEKNLLKSLDGQSTIEKVKLFLTHFDVIFDIHEQSVSTCKGCDILLISLHQHILICMVCSLINAGYNTIRKLREVFHLKFPGIQPNIANFEEFIASHNSYFAVDSQNVISIIPKFDCFANHEVSTEILNLVRESLKKKECMYYTEFLSLIKSNRRLLLSMINEMPITLMYTLKADTAIICKEGKVFLQQSLVERPVCSIISNNSQIRTKDVASSIDLTPHSEMNENILEINEKSKLVIELQISSSQNTILDICFSKQNCGGLKTHENLSDTENMLCSLPGSEFLVPWNHFRIESCALSSAYPCTMELELFSLNILESCPKFLTLKISNLILPYTRKSAKKGIIQDFTYFLYEKFRKKYSYLFCHSLTTTDDICLRFVNFMKHILAVREKSLAKSRYKNRRFMEKAVISNVSEQYLSSDISVKCSSAGDISKEANTLLSNCSEELQDVTSSSVPSSASGHEEYVSSEMCSSSKQGESSSNADDTENSLYYIEKQSGSHGACEVPKKSLSDIAQFEVQSPCVDSNIEIDTPSSCSDVLHDVSINFVSSSANRPEKYVPDEIFSSSKLVENGSNTLAIEQQTENRRICEVTKKSLSDVTPFDVQSPCMDSNFENEICNTDFQINGSKMQDIKAVPFKIRSSGTDDCIPVDSVIMKHTVSVTGRVSLLAKHSGVVRVTHVSDEHLVYFFRSAFTCLHRSFAKLKIGETVLCLVPLLDWKSEIWIACLVVPLCCKKKIAPLPEITKFASRSVIDVTGNSVNLEKYGTSTVAHNLSSDNGSVDTRAQAAHGDNDVSSQVSDESCGQLNTVQHDFTADNAVSRVLPKSQIPNVFSKIVPDPVLGVSCVCGGSKKLGSQISFVCNTPSNSLACTEYSYEHNNASPDADVVLVNRKYERHLVSRSHQFNMEPHSSFSQDASVSTTRYTYREVRNASCQTISTGSIVVSDFFCE